MSALTAVLGMILLSMNHEPLTGIILVSFSVIVIIRSYHVLFYLPSLFSTLSLSLSKNTKEYSRRTDILVDRTAYKWHDFLGPQLALASIIVPFITYSVYMGLFGMSYSPFAE